MKLNLNCEAAYLESFVSKEEANALFGYLMEYQELTRPFVITAMTGEKIESSNGKMMFIDKSLKEADRFPEAIWGVSHVWSEPVRELKRKVEEYTGQEFQTCVCIYYPDGTSGVEYHSDLSAFGSTDYIPSFSLGAERPFQLRELSTSQVHELVLQNGSLVIMGAHCQERYEHALPLDPTCQWPRINMTFRKCDK